MKIREHSHRHADIIIPHEAPQEYAELMSVLNGISEAEIIERFEREGQSGKSISRAINGLIHERLAERGWHVEAPIFQDEEYSGPRWRLDFAKGMLSVEVAFNHGEAIAWNLLKPILAGEYNHVRKAVQTRFGVIVCATQAMKNAGGFDSAVGSYEKFVRYLKPLQQVLTVPVMLLGIEAPDSFHMKYQSVDGRKAGVVVRSAPDIPSTSASE